MIRQKIKGQRQGKRIKKIMERTPCKPCPLKTWDLYYKTFYGGNEQSKIVNQYIFLSQIFLPQYNICGQGQQPTPGRLKPYWVFLSVRFQPYPKILDQEENGLSETDTLVYHTNVLSLSLGTLTLGWHINQHHCALCPQRQIQLSSRYPVLPCPRARF